MFALDVGSAHEVQIVNYLTAMGIKIGLLLNLGGVSRLAFKHIADISTRKIETG